MPGKLTSSTGTSVDAALTIAEQDALLGWLNELDDLDNEGDEADAAALRRG